MKVFHFICHWFLVCLLALTMSFSAWAEIRHVAILEFRGIGIKSEILLQLSDEARGGIREGLSIANFNVTSRENLQQILADMGKTIEECSVECEVSLGRDVGADFVLSGNLLKMEGTYLLTLKLHETTSGSLVSQKRLESSSIIDLFSKTNMVNKCDA